MEETYEYVDGYDNSNDYSDTLVFKISQKDKRIETIKEQPLLTGEQNSQYIRFELPRYYDGIDLSEKSIEVIYIAPDSSGDINKVINVQRSENTIQFGWVVPGPALLTAGVLAFCIEFVSDAYTLKTRQIELEVVDGMDGSAVVPEPVEQEWYVLLRAEFAAIKKSVSDGKELVATAITEKGVATESTDTFQTMADNIEQIKTGEEEYQISSGISWSEEVTDGYCITSGTSWSEEGTDGYDISFADVE